MIYIKYDSGFRYNHPDNHDYTSSIKVQPNAPWLSIIAIMTLSCLDKRTLVLNPDPDPPKLWRR
jgi:hypothetical protein